MPPDAIQPTSAPLDRLLRYSEAQRLLACSPSTLARLCAEGRLTPVYIATRSPRIRASEVHDLITRKSPTK